MATKLYHDWDCHEVTSLRNVPVATQPGDAVPYRQVLLLQADVFVLKWIVLLLMISNAIIIVEIVL